MQNITLLSLAISGSFLRSPFIQIPSSTKSCFSNFINIRAQYFLSSFLISQTFHSSSIVDRSIFDHFITSQPVLAFASKTHINGSNYYGNTIPKDNNPFYQTNYTSITYCRFMSISDNTQEQILPDVGLCIYTTKNTTVDFCYFFAIQSYRSGSCILFDQEDLPANSVVKNTIVKSVSQTLIDFGNGFLTGGAISHGRTRIDFNQMNSIFVDSAETTNCCFEKVRLISEHFNGRQLGILTYLTRKIKSSNINFTNNELGGTSQRYGAICVYFQQISENNISFINIFDSEFTQYGLFSVIFNTEIAQNLSLSFTNFINNTSFDDDNNPIFGIEVQLVNVSTFFISQIQCNSELPFVGISTIPNTTSSFRPVDVNIQTSVFRSTEGNLTKKDQYTTRYIKVVQAGNTFQQESFNLEIENNIISTLGYIQTSHFSPSNSFSNKFVQDSASYYDLSQDNPITAGVLATIFGIISFIVFIFLLCVRKGGSKKEYKVIGQFDDNDQFAGSQAENGISDNNDENELNDIGNERKAKSKKKGRKSTSIIETNNSIDNEATTQEDLQINSD